MIRFVISGGHEYTLQDIRKAPEAPIIETLSYDELIGSRRLPWATYVFTDFDRLACSDLELAGRIYQQLKSLKVKVLNDPARVKMRYGLLRALHHAGLNDFTVFRADELSDEIRFPVYIRKARGHGPPCTELLHSRQEIDQALEKEAGSGVEALGEATTRPENVAACKALNAMAFVAKPVTLQSFAEHIAPFFHQPSSHPAEADQSRIFQIFERLNPKTMFEGTGIGLAIVKKAMERMAGKIGVTVNEFGGCTFWFELPTASSSEN